MKLKTLYDAKKNLYKKSLISDKRSKLKNYTINSKKKTIFFDKNLSRTV